MATKTRSAQKPAFITAMEEELPVLMRAALSGPVRVLVEAVDKTKLYRVTIVCRGFDGLDHHDRQTLAWRAVEDSLPLGRRVNILSVATLTNAEYRQAGTS